MTALHPSGQRGFPAIRPMAGRLAYTLGTMRPSQLLLAIPLFLAIYATVLRSSVGGKTDLILDVQPLDQDFFSEHRIMSEQRMAVERAQQLTGRKERMESFSISWKGPHAVKDGPKVAFCATTSEPLKDIRHWLQWNRAIGVSHFYLFVQGRAGTQANLDALRQESGVTVIPDDAALRAAHASSRIWNETWLSSFFHKPCNHELFVLQSLNMEQAIQLARKDGIEWLLHIDTDELVHPAGTHHFSLQEVLAAVPGSVDVVIFPNHESLPERIDVNDPFVEVTLFKRNYQHIASDLYFKNYAAIAHSNPNYFITYANGKSAARIQDGLRPNGAHRWNSYDKRIREWTSESASVLHYTYNRLSDLKNRRDRCDCAPTEEDVKRCFILPFDRLAFLEASLKPDDELELFFRQHLLWNDTHLVNELVHKGLLMRLHEPQIMIRGFMSANGEAVDDEFRIERNISMDDEHVATSFQPPPVVQQQKPLSNSTSIPSTPMTYTAALLKSNDEVNPFAKLIGRSPPNPKAGEQEEGNATASSNLPPPPNQSLATTTTLASTQEQPLQATTPPFSQPILVSHPPPQHTENLATTS